MGKRKRESDERLEKKIRKLEKRLSKRKKKLHVVTSEDNTTDTSRPVSPQNFEPDTIESEETQKQIPGYQSEDQLDTEILELLGEPKDNQIKPGACIPGDIAKRWGDTLVMGQNKEQRIDILKKMVIPENFKLVLAPKLNPEIAAVLTDAAKNRDIRLEFSQNTLGLGIAGLSNLLSSIIKGNLDKISLIKSVSEIGQLLLNLHYDNSCNRKNLILPSVDKKFNNILKNSKRDAFLFGEQFGENIKHIKAMETSGIQLKKVYPPTQTRKVAINKENFRGPSCQQNPKTYRQGGRKIPEYLPKAASHRPNPGQKRSQNRPTRNHH